MKENQHTDNGSIIVCDTVLLNLVKNAESVSSCTFQPNETDVISSDVDKVNVTLDDLSEIEQEYADVIKFLDRRLLKLRTRQYSVRECNEKYLLTPDLLSNLDTNVRKISTFINKIKSFGGNNSSEIQNCLESEMLKFNLSKYLSEISKAVVGLKLNKVSRTTSIAHFCRMLSVRYPEFQNELIKSLEQNLQLLDNNRDPIQFRNELRLLAELILSSVFGTLNNIDRESNQRKHNPLYQAKLLLFKMIEKNTSNSSELNNFKHATVLMNFCKQYGDDLADVMPRPIKSKLDDLVLQRKWKQLSLSKQYHPNLLDLNAIRKASNTIADDESKKIKSILFSYYNCLLVKIKQLKLELKHIKSNNAHLLHTRGELSPEKRKSEEDQTSLFESFRTIVIGFNELLCEEDSATLDFILEEDETSSNNSDRRIEQDNEDYIWDTKEELEFYTQLPDLTTLLLPNKNVNCKLKKKLTAKSKQQNCGGDGDKNEQCAETLDTFLASLPNQNALQLIDQKCAEFYSRFNTRSSRKKLIQHLSRLTRVHNELLPFYARFVASLSVYHPNVGLEISNSVVKQFKYHLRKKDQINLDMKLKRMRFIGELIKFSLIPKHDALQLIKLLLNNFVYHNIEMCCTLLETCGHFLYQSKSSNNRCHAYLEIMMRKMNACHFNDRYKVLVESAYNACKPLPEVVNNCALLSFVKLPKQHQFILYLLTNKLSKISTYKLSKSLEKMDWADADFNRFALECFSSPHVVRFNHIVHLANLLSELSQGFLHKFALQAIDIVIESMLVHHLQDGFSSNRYDNQKLICLARYFAEFYNFALIDYTVLLKVLFSIISPNKGEIEDPPYSLIRIRMVCIILILTGPRLEPGDNLNSICQFANHFQCYYWMKKSYFQSERFPEDIDQFVYDALRKIDNKIIIAKSLNEAFKLINCPINKQNGISLISSTMNSISVRTLNNQHNDSKMVSLINNAYNEEDNHVKDIEADQEILRLFDNHVQSQYRDRSNYTNNGKRRNKGTVSLGMLTAITRSSIQGSSSSSPPSLSTDDNSNNTNPMCFRLLSLRNNKPKLQPVNIPISSDMYAKILEEKRIAHEEREEIKRLTLNISEMQSIEEQQRYDEFGL